MSVLIVGNILKDVYLNLDDRTNHFEVDRDNIKWLNVGFDASSNYFFSRNSSLGGAAVSLEVFEKIGIPAQISDSNLKLEQGELINTTDSAEAYRYILIASGTAHYLVSSHDKPTDFTPPADPVDYLYIDRSAKLTDETTNKIDAYLDFSKDTKLILYLKSPLDFHLKSLIPRAQLVILEDSVANLPDIDPDKTIKISETKLSYLNITEPINPHRIDISTHLSIYSIASATILGSFILGRSVEESLKLARANIENAKLDAVLNLSELEEIAKRKNPKEDLELVAASLLVPKKGILAADESGGSIKKKFAQLNIEDTYENRRDYRNIFFTTKDLEKYASGVILFDETARQTADNGQNFVDFLTARRIIPGIKVDQGLEPLKDSEETYTKGLDGLPERLAEYYNMGLRFAKWRSAFEIRLGEFGEILTPTSDAIARNCRDLADYAKKCQEAGIVPIVEPEVVYDGNYTIDQCAETTGKILDKLFEELDNFHVNLKACILKVNMVLAGKQFETQSTPEEVGQKTAEVLKTHVPDNLAGVVFLSGGQTVEQATDNLAAVIKNGPFPWPVTFSFARALQDPALYAWAGDNNNNNNIEKAREAFHARLIANTDVLEEQK